MKTLLIIPKTIVCAAFVSFSLLACSAFADTSVWKVSKGKNYFYIGGTVHILSEADHPLPKEFDIAYKDAGEIFFETDLVAIQTPAFQNKMAAAMVYKDDRVLASELEPVVYKKLEEFMAARQMTIADFTKFQPWAVMMMLSMLEYERLGMIKDYGVDIHFNKLALKEGKKVKGLETAEEQLSFLKSLANIEPNKNVEYTLRDLEGLKEFIEQMKKYWRSGDIDSLSASPSIVEMKNDFPVMYKTFLTNRNNAWMQQLPTLLDSNNKAFVLVGVLHLGGKDGLVSLLKREGFKVEQL